MAYYKDFRGTQRQFSENICSEDDLRSRIFGTLIVKFLACLPFLSLRSADVFPVVASLPPKMVFGPEGEKRRPEIRLRFAGCSFS